MPRRRPTGGWRVFADGYPVLVAVGFLQSADVSWYLHPFLDVVGAVLPLVLIGMFSTARTEAHAQRRALLGKPPRTRAIYLCLALGWAVASGSCALLGWAARASQGGEDWIATGLVWATAISGCAAVMMAGRALTAATARRPNLLARPPGARPRDTGEPLPVASPSVSMPENLSTLGGSP
ncbi:MAG TPA: hypothetical protein VMU95_31520 [Trebonia sp.]|nr:hypothetical protein [Trebonia sp.]